MSTASKIVLSIPPQAEWISLVRLASSGVASRCGFDIDTIEDIKVCVSEILNKVINSPFAATGRCVALSFEVLPGSLAMEFEGEGLHGTSLFPENDDFALAILDTLMDEVTLANDGKAAVRMVKATGRAAADD